jgi:TRAP-type C4-dicarboxylate transport system permease small subunit
MAFRDMSFLERISHGLARKLYWVAGTAIVAMMLLTCADVILRYYRRPIPGTYELVCFLGAMAVAFAMAHTSVERGHVAVSIVVQLFPQRIQGLIESITSSFGFVFFALIAWQSVLYANDLRSSGEVSLTLQLPFYPFVYGVGFSAAAVCLVLLADLFKNLMKVFAK